MKQDLTPSDFAGLLETHRQRAEETRFAQFEEGWTSSTVMEDVLILIVVFCCCIALPVGYVLFKVFA